MDYLRTYSQNTKDNIELPFKVKFNFEQLINYWRAIATQEESGEEVSQAKKLLSRIEKEAPALLQPFESVLLIEQHEQLLKILFSPLFPKLTTKNDIKAIAIPFIPIIFNPTERLTQILDDAGKEQLTMMRQGDPNLSYINACIFILRFKYGIQINHQQAVYFDIPNTRIGILRHYRAFINADFSSFTAHDHFIPLSKEDIQELMNNFHNIDLWKSKIPPNSFTYEGFSIVKLFDVTTDEAISALKADLLKKDALQTKGLVASIRQHLISVLGIEDLQLGFAAYDKKSDCLKTLGHGHWNSLSLSGEIAQANSKAFCIHTRASLFDDQQVLILSGYTDKDLKKIPFLPKVAANNILSYIAIPLVYNKEIIGIFELGSSKPHALNSIVASKLERITPLFTTALKRLLDEQETKLEAIVQDQFTAIHPSVSWRFFDAAADLLKQKQVDSKATVAEISFPEVYPLFGQSDIKGSSTERNNAIQADMIEQLTMVKNIIDLAITNHHLPIYQQLKYKLTICIQRMKKGLGAGDEIEVLEFLKEDIYPVFKHFQTLGPVLTEAIESYKQALDEELGVIYKRRKDYEQSVGLINNTMANYLTKMQLQAQDMFPHYFEKYKTDGVEHSIYIGQSIVQRKAFNKLHLQNLRLWQLMTICEMEQLMVAEIKPQLKVPLEIASLILVHHNPITIKFRQEEKRFDVEGAYNIRYEIIKKRIDKATIKGTAERLTQPGKIAIVYSQDKEAREYRQYLDYLHSINYIDANIEWLDLNDLQGVTGLKAIRVKLIHPFKINDKGIGKK